MKYKVGDRVQVKSLEELEEYDNGDNEYTIYENMKEFAEQIVTIEAIDPYGNGDKDYHIEEDDGEDYWTDDMFSGLASECKTPKSHKFKIGDIVHGVKGAPYTFTDEDMKQGQVIAVYDVDCDDEDDIRVKILEHSNNFRVGDEWKVNSKYFKLVEPTEKEKPINPWDTLFKREYPSIWGGLDATISATPTWISFGDTWGADRTTRNPGDRVRLKDAELLTNILNESPWADRGILQRAGQVVTIAGPHSLNKTWYKIKEDTNTYSEEMFN